MRAHYKEPLATKKLSRELNTLLVGNNRQIILCCIGTDRATGDSFGPLIGEALKKRISVPVYGTLENPVHACNLKQTLDCIYTSNELPLVIAVDSCLGKYTSIGYITVSEESFRPGAGVNKSLPPVGDISITGVVNFGSNLITLQNTRLYLVMRMAETVINALLEVIG